ncbi:hypothetical protein BRADI_1g28230v3 [Brachypodium distachyon]|uniref:BHLH domain-containing protein n=1 Tax=Brachypodium distachyon TaxID=15368 RepID=A0A2K2DLK9_BRADI|nr:hypothetical protein BRADI_1g28230v3 [Brachypodium distachyon]
MRCMAQEGSEASVASSPPPPHPPSSSSSASAGASWWRGDMHPNYSSATPAWPPPSAAAAGPRWPPLPLAHHQQQHQQRTSSSGADDDMSASNATMQTSFTSHHSGISIDESSAAAAAAAESHLWNQVLMGAGGAEVARSMQAVHDAHGDDDSENFLELLNSRTLAPELFAEPPACDYLKKMEYGASWAPPPDHQFTAAATNMEKHHQMDYINALAHQQQQQQQERGLTTANLSDLVSNWSIAPPSPCHGGGGGAKALFLDSGGNVKHEMGHGHGAGPGMLQQQEAAGGPGSSGQDFVRPVGGIGSYSPMLGLSSRMYGGSGDSMVDVQWAGPGSNGDRTTSLSDLISFGGAMGKPAPAAASPGKTSSSGEYKKMSSPAKTSSGGGGGKGSSASSGEGKKKRSEEQQQGSEGSVKKSKQQQQEASSPTSSLKAAQVPKVKLGDKINALQQIVSPFGKLLSDPYMKSSSSKDYNPWGGLDRKEKAEAEADLRSRGLCLVPVSCTPQVYRDSNGPDYWTPPYRSCLYR